MALITLPPELKLNIADSLDPDSTLNFALTCRDHATLLKSLLKQHARLLAKWKVIDTTDARTLLWETLRDVIANPRLGWYIRELNLPESRQYNWNANESLRNSHPKHGVVPSEKDKALFIEAARGLQDLYPGFGVDESNLLRRYSHAFNFSPRPYDTIGSIEDRIHAGFEDAIIAILLHHLPYLTTIRHSEVGMEDCLELVLWQIALGYKNPVMAPKLPLQHLKTVAVRYALDEGSSSPDWACFYLSIPSVKTFVGQAMGGSPSEDVLRTLFPTGAAPCSDVEELFFRHSVFDVDGLATILANIRHLKKLTYNGGDALVSDSSWYEPKKVIRAVATHAGRSLEELMLSEEDTDSEPPEDGPAIVSLREFQKLRVLHCQWRMLRPDMAKEGDPEHDEPLEQGYYRKEDYEQIDVDFDVRTLLPESLEEFYMNGDFHDYDEWEHMENTVKASSAFTPHLSMDKTCIKKGGYWSDRIGTAEEPDGAWSHPLGRLFEGHHG
ncbi:uncharacterized protein J4E92_009817 [Alternaria infectoria]|uniref:uncharacterized protein n=1 Tax=Alternaria infectoria TaxID=45303 RepID=UPI002220BE9F|nr:uncharacterized protein J4E92_009817 [Alternaria infectoria]KAI4913194.1 hypothetical protein J4E92_009817 [Alternaria infectoria]